MALWSALIVTVYTLVCVYEWVWVGVCFCHSFSVSFILFFVLLSFFCSFFDSITNLIQVQDVVTSQASCQPSYSIDRTATVTACPEGYSALFIPRNSYRSVTRYIGLQGTTVSFNVTNISSATNNVGANGWLVYYPSSWNI